MRYVVECEPGDDLQQKLNEAAGRMLVLLPGLHETGTVTVPANTTLRIPQGATVRLADDADMPHKGGSVIQAKGAEDKPLRGVKIILDGVVDGNKEAHPYSESGNEGIDFYWCVDCAITGIGTVRNASGDGVDVDAITRCFFEGISLIDNGGTGFHFGSPRPIRPSRYNVAVGLYAEGNGFGRQRRGFDHSWPNKDGITYIGCIAKDNYRNWQIDGEGGVVVACRSIDTGRCEQPDKIKDALYAQVL